MPKTPTDIIKQREEFLKTIVECSKKPSKFAELFLDHKLFDYQREYADSNEPFQFVRYGRQCIRIGEYIYTDNGIRKIEELKHGDHILGGIVSKPHKFDDDIYRITFWNGVKIDVNGEHPFMTNNGWKHASNLTNTDFVEFSSGKLLEGSFSMGMDMAKLFGYMYSDGYYTNRQSPKFVNLNESFISKVAQLAVKSYPQLNPTYSGYDTRLFLITKHGSTQNPLIDYIRENDLMNNNTFGSIQNLKTDELWQFVRGYFNGDGCLWTKKRPDRDGYRTEIGFAIGLSERKAYEFQYMLWRLGVSSVVKKEWMNKSTNWFYRVLVSKKKDLSILLDKLDNSKYPHKFKLAKYHNDLRKNDNFIKGNYVKIRKIENIGHDTVVGFEVNPTHEIYSYLGMRTHNSGKTMTTAVKAVHAGFYAPLYVKDENTKQFTILIIAPTKDQSAIMFSNIRSLIVENDFLNQYVVKNTQTEIWFRSLDNTMLTKIITRATGEKGTSTRGYSPNIIIIDEVAFIKESIIEALLPSGFATHARIWIMSTPFGTNNWYYKQYEDSRPHNPEGMWKEFYAKSTDNPMSKGNPLFQAYLKGLSTDSYRQEVEAEFLDIGNALIPRSLLMEAISDRQPRGFVRYYLGVDVARTGKDETVFTLIGVDENDDVYVIDTYAEGQSNLVDIVDRIGSYVNDQLRPIETVYVDETGIGGGVIDLAHKRDLPIRGVTFTLTEKSKMYGNIRTLFENHRVKLRNIDKLLHQLSYLKREYTEQGVMKIKTEDETVHDDYADSFALACQAVLVGSTWHVLSLSKKANDAIFG